MSKFKHISYTIRYCILNLFSFESGLPIRTCKVLTNLKTNPKGIMIISFSFNSMALDLLGAFLWMKMTCEIPCSESCSPAFSGIAVLFTQESNLSLAGFPELLSMSFKKKFYIRCFGESFSRKVSKISETTLLVFVPI